jgi:uncharacterized SAM-binding protein YcdF (DUF218 family)
LLLVLLATAAWGLLKRRRAFIAAGLIGIFAAAWQPLTWVWAQPLEAWYSLDPPVAGGEAIVVLAAGIEPPEIAGSPATLRDNTSMRCRHALWIWKKNPRLPVLLCGGSAPWLPTPASAVMRRTMADGGVPDSLLWTEERSTSTYENALFGTEILRQKGVRSVILVTEAYHMLRSERCFRKQGIQVIPAACNFTAMEKEANGVVPGAIGLAQTEQTLHEIIGLSWYLVRGRI